MERFACRPSRAVCFLGEASVISRAARLPSWFGVRTMLLAPALELVIAADDPTAAARRERSQGHSGTEETYARSWRRQIPWTLWSKHLDEAVMTAAGSCARTGAVWKKSRRLL